MSETVKTTGTYNPDEMARMAKERNSLYSLLAAVFREEITKDLLQQLLDSDFQKGLADAGVDTGALSALKPNKALLEDLSLEFTRLFFGPGKHVSPYESVHLGGDGGTLWGPQTVAVKRFIEQSGFAYNRKFHGLPDHISVELEFMAHLTSLEADAWEDGEVDQALNSMQFQKEFLTRHLGLWVTSFSEKVAEQAETPVYPQLALLARDFIGAECQEFDEMDGLKKTVH